ncbi:MAG: hypothetical protein HY909_27830 [Deltaproteobacteria bacterium]|nr:hypothetical protein [Deltaproteobacteria bacterium]
MTHRHATVFSYSPRGGPLVAHPAAARESHWAVTPDGLAPAPSPSGAHAMLLLGPSSAWLLPRAEARVEAEGRVFLVSLQLHDHTTFCLVHAGVAAWGCFSLEAAPWQGTQPPEAPCQLCGRPLGAAPALHCGRCGKAFHDNPSRRCLATLGTCPGCLTPYDPSGTLRAAPRWG